ncbi:MAG: SMC-Scp complex subunit ScpB [Candidatus Anstonellales archaeon]
MNGKQSAQDKKRLIEAALFMSSREISPEELKKITGIDAPGYIIQLIDELAEEYKQRGSAVEIKEIAGKYIMGVKEEYLPSVKEFAKETELSKGALRVLAYVANNNGILKSEVVKVLGTQAYSYIKEITEKGFVKQVKAGRSKRLHLTDRFKAYFKKE